MAEKIDRLMTESERFDILKQKVSSTGVDAFRVRVTRREQAHLQPELMATFEGVTFDSLGQPEVWLPELFGGGAFELKIAHMGNVNEDLFPPLKMTYPSHAVKRLTPFELHQAINADTYRGPRGLIYPKMVSATATTTEKPPVFATPTQSTTTVGGPATPVLQQVQAVGTQPERVEAARLTLVQESLMRQEKELAQRELDMKLAAMKAEMFSGQPQQKGMDMVGLLTAAAPFIMGFLESRKAADARMFQIQADNANRQMEMMKLLTQKPELDPAIRELLDKASKKDDFGMMKNMTEMMGAMTTTTMQIIQSQAEMMAASQPQQDSPQMKLAQTGLKVLGAILSKTPMAPDEDEQQQPEEEPQQEQAALPEKKKFSQLELLERLLIRKAPKEKVAERFLKALKSPKFTGHIQKHFDGNYIKMLESRVLTWQLPDGSLWAADEKNIDYIQETGMYIYRVAQKAGFFAPDEAEKPKETKKNGAGAVETPSKIDKPTKAEKIPAA